MDANERLDALKAFRAQMAGKSHFELLGVEQAADDAAVRSAYFGLIKRFGADYFNQVTDAESRAAIDDVNKQLRKAYDALVTQEKRDAYIKSLETGVMQGEEAHIDIAEVFECEQALSQARALMERGEFKVALTKLQKAQKLDPKSPEIKVRLGYVEFMLMGVNGEGKRPQAEVREIRAELENGCGDLPKADYLRVFLGDIENLGGNSAKALYWYGEALKINPDNLPAQREIRLMDERKKKEKLKADALKTFFDRLKAIFNKKL